MQLFIFLFFFFLFFDFKYDSEKTWIKIKNCAALMWLNRMASLFINSVIKILTGARDKRRFTMKRDQHITLYSLASSVVAEKPFYNLS